MLSVTYLAWVANIKMGPGSGFGLMRFQDSYGIPAPVLTPRLSDNGSSTDHMMALESVILRCPSYKDIIDILPGQAVIIQRGHEPVFFQIQEQKAYALDMWTCIKL